MMGRVCKRLDRLGDAIRHFSTALDLDPANSNAVKIAIDKIDVADADDDEDVV